MGPTWIAVTFGAVVFVFLGVLILTALVTGPASLESPQQEGDGDAEDGFYRVEGWPDNAQAKPNVWRRGDPLPEVQVKVPDLPPQLQAVLDARAPFPVPARDPTVDIRLLQGYDLVRDFPRHLEHLLSLQNALGLALSPAPDNSLPLLDPVVRMYEAVMTPLVQKADQDLAALPPSDSRRAFAYALKRVALLPLARNLQARLPIASAVALQRLGVVFVQDPTSGHILKVNPDVTIELMWRALDSWSAIHASVSVPKCRLLRLLPMESQLERWLDALNEGLVEVGDVGLLEELVRTTLWRSDSRIWEACRAFLGPHGLVSVVKNHGRLGANDNPVPSTNQLATEGHVRFGFVHAGVLALQLPIQGLLDAASGSSDALFDDGAAAAPLSDSELSFLGQFVNGALADFTKYAFAVRHSRGNAPPMPGAVVAYLTVLSWLDPAVHDSIEWRSSLLATVVQRLWRKPSGPGQLRSFEECSPGMLVPTELVHPQTMFLLALMHRQNVLASAHVSLALHPDLFTTGDIGAWAQGLLHPFNAAAIPLSLPQILPNGTRIGESADCGDAFDYGPQEQQLAYEAYRQVALRRLMQAATTYRETLCRITRPNNLGGDPVNAIDGMWYQRFMGPGTPLQPAALTGASQELYLDRDPVADRPPLVATMQTWTPEQCRRFCLFLNGSPHAGNYWQNGDRFFAVIKQDGVTISPGSFALDQPSWLQVGAFDPATLHDLPAVFAEIIRWDCSRNDNNVGHLAQTAHNQLNWQHVQQSRDQFQDFLAKRQ